MDNTDTLLEVGLGFTADFNKPDGFIGKEEVVKQKKFLSEKGGEENEIEYIIYDCQLFCPVCTTQGCRSGLFKC